MKKPSFVAGLALILLSYLACWPLISVLGLFSTYFDRPDIVQIGGPGAYIFSHFLLLLGVLLSGKEGIDLAQRHTFSFFRRFVIPEKAKRES